ncbi:MAG: hypothetical protein K5870_08520, partial [Lachnospiraceae bacterium]|nr:hypothetical protein [Lachnospiraceae bacterium]
MKSDFMRRIISGFKRTGSMLKLSLLIILAASLILMGCSDDKDNDDKEDTEKVETQKKDGGSESEKDKKDRYIVGKGIREDD